MAHSGPPPPLPIWPKAYLWRACRPLACSPARSMEAPSCWCGWMMASMQSANLQPLWSATGR